MKDNQKIITIGGKDIVVTFDPSSRELMAVTDCESKLFEPQCDDELDDNCQISCHLFETQETWDRDYEVLILPAAIKVLRDESASSQIKDLTGFIQAALEFVAYRVCIKRLDWHERWSEDRSFFNSLKQQLTSRILVDDQYSLKYVQEIVRDSPGYCQQCEPTTDDDNRDFYLDGCSDCGYYCVCEYNGSCKNLTEENEEVPVHSASTRLLEEAAEIFATRNPHVKSWSDEFLKELANDIELDLAQDYLSGNGPGTKHFS